MILDKKSILSDLWYTPPAIFKACDEAGGKKGVFDPTTDTYAIRLQELHGTKVQGFTASEDFLSFPNDVEIPKGLGKVSLCNSPYSVSSGGAKPYVQKHLDLCAHHKLFAVEVLNAAIGSKWFHSIIDDLINSNRDFRIGLVEGRLRYWGQVVRWKKDDIEQDPCFIASLQPYVKKHKVEIIETIGVEESTSPRYDNVLLYVAPPKYSVYDTMFLNILDRMKLEGDFKHSVRWLGI